MRALRLTLLLALGALLLATPGCSKSPEKPGKGKSASRRAGLKAGKAPGRRPFDKNGDGRLDDAERKARRAHIEKSALPEYDANKNGKLDPEEEAKFREDRGARLKKAAQGRVEKIMGNHDTDGDGRISRAEFDAKPQRRPKLFDRADVNKDAHVDRAELSALLERIGSRKRGVKRK